VGAAEGELGAFAVIVRAIEAIILAVTLDDGLDGEEFGLAVLWWWQHFSPKRCLMLPTIHCSSELVWLVKCTVYKVCGIIIRCLIK
jgi:hypothetical protein